MAGTGCQLSPGCFGATGGVCDIVLEVSHQFLSSVAKLLPTVLEKAGEYSLALPASSPGRGDMAFESQKQK